MIIYSRKMLLTCASIAGLVIVSEWFASPSFAQTTQPATVEQIAPATAPSRITMVAKTEPGEPMIIIGHVTDGIKPIKNASVFVFHTDIDGYYANHKSDIDAETQPRLHGAMRTDAEGRYEYKTIRPASYPNTRFPAHVHYVVHADGYRDVFTEFNFDDDPFMNEGGKREWNAAHHRGIVKMTKDGKGAWRGVFDITLTKSD